MPLGRHDIPNALTIARLALAVVFFAMLAVATPDAGGLLIASAIVFGVAAATDALDGFLARRWNAITPFGRVMDPFADKVLVLGGFVMLAAPNLAIPMVTIAGSADPVGVAHPPRPLTGVAAWMTVLILARELLITSIRGVYESRGVDFSASFSGKAKMIVQSVAVPTILVITAMHPALGITTASAINAAIAWSVVVITAASGVPYLARALAHRGSLA